MSNPFLVDALRNQVAVKIPNELTDGSDPFCSTVCKVESWLSHVKYPRSGRMILSGVEVVSCHMAWE